ncbi:hypothetical protein RN001_002423 [Aquatica leii]|uniref:Uncharacterized protein n=1 Tax=Aquatica leii TaxID=1421715 RepID=A0AAN7PGZ0_9COLE|nr:hypothetical protein RN001_002423 [Aquatica leii]
MNILSGVFTCSTFIKLNIFKCKSKVLQSTVRAHYNGFILFAIGKLLCDIYLEFIDTDLLHKILQKQNIIIWILSSTNENIKNKRCHSGQQKDLIS